ncbi:hypothetical protein TW95_gp1819 [Pandoravirus inopinatum]|uniref:Uncharacterized protein n=1 Tax=Pandoravirus inopinatum TaxID=1605721 RepID=A0A0B5J013_9VIRU|nr:hypothetical protein TW95_gp1819 [Pandoravirus inopinatum]AJF98553.1 hypothetical protein [Pandoravirus inopinatum]
MTVVPLVGDLHIFSFFLLSPWRWLCAVHAFSMPIAPFFSFLCEATAATTTTLACPQGSAKKGHAKKVKKCYFHRQHAWCGQVGQTGRHPSALTEIVCTIQKTKNGFHVFERGYTKKPQ